MKQPKCSRCGAGPFADLNEWSNHDCSRPNWEPPLKSKTEPVAKLQCSDGLEAAALAKRFHETYERLAPQFDYKTREESKVAWDDVPEANKNLMIATCAEILKQGI
jgi:hypothetical protein